MTAKHFPSDEKHNAKYYLKYFLQIILKHIQRNIFCVKIAGKSVDTGTRNTGQENAALMLFYAKYMPVGVVALLSLVSYCSFISQQIVCIGMMTETLSREASELTERLVQQKILNMVLRRKKRFISKKILIRI
jgi:hypothetical protein